MKIGLSTMFLGDTGVELLDGFVRDHAEQIKCCDVWYDTPFHLLSSERDRPAIIETIKRLKADTDLETVTHLAAIDVNPIAYNPSARAFTLSETKASMRFAAEIGSTRVTIHGGFNSFNKHVSRFDLRLLEMFIDEIIEFNVQENLGLEISLENESVTPNFSRPLESLHFMTHLLEKYPEVKVTLDLAHVLKSSLPEMKASIVSREPRLDSTNLSGFLKTFGDRVQILHVSIPNGSRTHGRCKIHEDSPLIPLLDLVANHVDKNIPIILEEEMDAGVEMAMENLIRDAIALNATMERLIGNK